MATRARRHRFAVLTTLSALTMAVLVVIAPAHGADTVPFAPRFTTNANGSLITIGNATMTCPTGATSCTAAQAGGNYD
ncbi:MAG: hypothetical protein FWG16_01990, partial [Micrococcales bacterium]|nr:hypothetical protein [Micrococcales bacterium]